MKFSSNLSYLLLLVLLSFSTSISAQKADTTTKEISVEDIWQDYTFYPKSVPGFNFQRDGKHYTLLEKDQVRQYDLTTGEFTKTLFNGSDLKTDDFDGAFSNYAFSEDEKNILITTNSEAIYRRSSKANFFVYDGKSLTALDAKGKQRDATFSPKADKVAYSIGNNLYYKDLKKGSVVQITEDGKQNEIINGGADWVYEEEFSFAKAFEWSPDGKKIAFMRFDESRVREFTMTLYNDDVYPEYQTFKYPKVGEDNSIVTVHIYDLKNNKITKIDLANDYEYIPRIKWTQDANTLCITKMNRHQNELELVLADAKTGKTRSLLKETNKYYINITDNLTFLKNGKQFIWTSEESGFNHVYLYDLKGKMIRPLTKGDYDVTSLYGIDEKNNLIYYQAATQSPMQREIYSADVKSVKKRKLTEEDGSNSAQFSSTFDYFVNTFSTANKASTFIVYDRSGKMVRTIEDNSDVADLQKEYGIAPVEFFDFKTTDGTMLNGWMVKPTDFKEGRKYPVLMHVYGGPGSQTVQDQFGGFNYWWHQMLVQKGYIIVSIDNRGTGARGQEFKKMTYQQLGKYETIDQIEGAKYLATQDYVDAERIGIWGWSYGGYMSSLCLLKGNDVFKTAIAVAPVTNWKWYDSIYTERYMRTNEENPSGYADNSPVYFADQLKGNYLIVHGVADDNVHFQNTTEMVNALVMANKQFDTYFYPNRNHGIYGGPTRLHLYNKMTRFLLEKL
ncbi:MAG: dipeptidyl-peptidase-4 [Polaribacter sp.]|jgi:dipeptidyl-peptidase-4